MSALGLPKTQHVQQGINVQLQLLPLPGQVREGQTGLGHSQLQSRADDLQPDSKWEEKKRKIISYSNLLFVLSIENEA